MKRCLNYLKVAVVAMPIIIGVILLIRPNEPRGIVAAVVVGVIIVAILSEILWNQAIRPISSLLSDLNLSTISEIKRHIDRLEAKTRLHELDRADLAHLIEDISTGLGEGLLVVDPSHRVRLANPRALQFLGVSEIETGASLLQFELEPGVINAVRDALNGELNRRVMVENPRGVWEIRPFPLSRGGAVALVTEVGQLHRAAELRRRFVQDLSHEIRSPLAVIRTTVEAMDDELPADISRMMVRQVERITRLTDELYELASIEAGTLKMEAEYQTVGPVIQQICCDFQAVAARARVDLDSDFPEEFSFEFDKRALSRVISNLVDNSIKYNRSGGWVKVTAKHHETSAQFHVEDSGLGIPASELGAVMQRFYRVDRARTPGAGGLGLGLAIVKHMVQQMGGELTIDSREDVGTRVTVTFPIGETQPGTN